MRRLQGGGCGVNVFGSDRGGVLASDRTLGTRARAYTVSDRTLGTRAELVGYMRDLAERLSRVRVCCGNWDRICGPSPTTKLGITGVFLDPPYADLADRQEDLYASDSSTVAHEVKAWALERGDDPMMRIALCGYEGEHDMPDTWECIEWKARGGYGSQGDGRGRDNAARERIWFSPHCTRPQYGLFADARWQTDSQPSRAESSSKV